ncbi:MAG: MobF family relaxase [Dehalococcoidia bacterium]
MLSVSVAASAGYYSGLVGTAGYYLEGGEPPGVWLGRGAAELGLTGTVSPRDLAACFDGLDPRDESRSLVQRQTYRDGRTRQGGWDLTFSAPKSVSTLWSQLTDPEARRRIQAAHFAAVKTAAHYLEENAAFTRRGKGGAGLERAGLVLAAFEHGTSRLEDPQLHTHLLVLNLALRKDGSWGTLRSRDLFWHQMVGGAIYRNELARHLEGLGYSTERTENGFELKGVLKELMEEFSKRSQQIREAMEKAGAEGARAAEAFALATRTQKGHVARNDLFSAWKAVGERFGFDPETLPVTHARTRTTQELTRMTERALGQVSEKESHFPERALLRRTLELVEGRGFRLDEVLDSVRRVEHGPAARSLGVEGGYERFTTEELYRCEERMLELARASRGENDHPVAPEHLRRVLERYPSLGHEQREALEQVTRGPGSVQCVIGMAGTGKTTLFRAAREAWESEGFEVRGAAISARAKEELAAGTGIESSTIAKLLLDQGKARDWDGPEEKRPRALGANTVLVVDESGMVDTRAMERILREARNAGSKVVLVGDPDQLQSVDAGAPFRTITETVGAKELTEIRRQREEWARDAVHLFANGDAQGALSLYAEHGCLEVAPTRAKAITALLDSWEKERSDDLKESLILAGTKAEVRAINGQVQERRLELGELDEKVCCFKGEERFFGGDRVLFTKNHRGVGVVNGDFGTIESFDTVGGRSFLTLRLDRTVNSGSEPLRVTVDPVAVPDFQLGYSGTTHKAQGATVDRAWVLAGGSMQDRELTYVQASRAREQTKIFATEAAVGEDLSELCWEMSRSRQKEIAHRVEERLRGPARGYEMVLARPREEREREP